MESPHSQAAIPYCICHRCDLTHCISRQVWLALWRRARTLARKWLRSAPSLLRVVAFGRTWIGCAHAAVDSISWNILHPDFRKPAAPHHLHLPLRSSNLIPGNLSSIASPRSATKLRISWRSYLFSLTALMGMHQSGTTRNSLRSSTCTYALVAQSILARTRSFKLATNLRDLTSCRCDRVILTTALNNLERHPARDLHSNCDQSSPPDARNGLGKCSLL